MFASDCEKYMLLTWCLVRHNFISSKFLDISHMLIISGLCGIANAALKPLVIKFRSLPVKVGAVNEQC